MGARSKIVFVVLFALICSMGSKAQINLPGTIKKENLDPDDYKVDEVVGYKTWNLVNREPHTVFFPSAGG